jgi:hypothetical protein
MRHFPAVIERSFVEEMLEVFSRAWVDGKLSTGGDTEGGNVRHRVPESPSGDGRVAGGDAGEGGVHAGSSGGGGRGGGGGDPRDQGQGEVSGAGGGGGGGGSVENVPTLGSRGHRWAAKRGMDEESKGVSPVASAAAVAAARAAAASRMLTETSSLLSSSSSTSSAVAAGAGAGAGARATRSTPRRVGSSGGGGSGGGAWSRSRIEGSRGGGGTPMETVRSGELSLESYRHLSESQPIRGGGGVVGRHSLDIGRQLSASQAISSSGGGGGGGESAGETYLRPAANGGGGDSRGSVGGAEVRVNDSRSSSWVSGEHVEAGYARTAREEGDSGVHASSGVLNRQPVRENGDGEEVHVGVRYGQPVREVDRVGDAIAMPAWASAILASLPPQALDLGFSEYGAYASWVSAHHPETVQLAPRRLWSRHPMGPLVGSLGIALQRAARSDGLCCPGAIAVKGMKLMGYQYIGFEAGHVASCGYNDPKHAESYGA